MPEGEKKFGYQTSPFEPFDDKNARKVKSWYSKCIEKVSNHEIIQISQERNEKFIKILFLTARF